MARHPAIFVLCRLFDIVSIWFQRTRERRMLMTFDDRMLRDIALSRADAFAEWSKPFWKA